MPKYYLCHYGIPNQKWGIRRFQNKDGSLTKEGKLRYGIGEDGRASNRDAYARDLSVNVMEEGIGVRKEFRQTRSKITEKEYQQSLQRKAESLSDEELRATANRLNLENNYINSVNAKRDRESRARIGSFIEEYGDFLMYSLGAAATVGSMVVPLFKSRKTDKQEETKETKEKKQN